MSATPEPRFTKRPTVAVVYEDVTGGFRCADWFARHGYQATIASVQSGLEEGALKELRPDVIVVGLSSTPASRPSPVPRLRTTYPCVPIIAMIDPAAVPSAGPSTMDFVKTFGADVFMCRSLDPPSPRSA